MLPRGSWAGPMPSGLELVQGHQQGPGCRYSKESTQHVRDAVEAHCCQLRHCFRNDRPVLSQKLPLRSSPHEQIEPRTRDGLHVPSQQLRPAHPPPPCNDREAGSPDSEALRSLGGVGSRFFAAVARRRPGRQRVVGNNLVTVILARHGQDLAAGPVDGADLPHVLVVQQDVGPFEDQ